MRRTANNDFNEVLAQASKWVRTVQSRCIEARSFLEAVARVLGFFW